MRAEQGLKLRLILATACLQVQRRTITAIIPILAVPPDLTKNGLCLWEVIQLIALVCMTFMEMYGSGVTTGMGAIVEMKQTLLARIQELIAFFVAAVGTAMLRSAVLRIASGTTRRTRAATPVFVFAAVRLSTSLHWTLGFLDTWTLEIF